MVVAMLFILPFLAAMIGFVVGTISWIVCRNLRRSIRANFICLAVIAAPFCLEAYVAGLADGKGFLVSFLGPVLILVWLMLAGVFASFLLFVFFWGLDSEDESPENNADRQMAND